MSDNEILENIRVGYQVANTLRVERANEIWSQFNAMVTSHSILIAATVALFTTTNVKGARWLAWIGLILCVLWFFLHGRGRYWVGRYRNASLKLESHLEGVNTLQGDPGKKQRNIFIFRITWLSFVIIGLFAVAYALLILVTSGQI